YQTRYHNFAPRIGAAYLLRNAVGHETVLRGGFGLFYDLIGTGVGTAYGIGYPYGRIRMVPGSNTAAGVPFPLDPPSAAPPPINLNPPFLTFRVLDPSFDLPYTYQWNLAVEQSLGTNQTITASYVAAVGRRLLRQEQVRVASQNPNFTN